MRNKASLTLTAAAALAAMTFGLASGARADTLSAPLGKPGVILLAEAETDAAERQMMHLSEDGMNALRDVYGARVAIFEGQPKEAEKLLGHAKSALRAAAKMADKLSIKPKKGESGVQLPIDARITLADDFILTPEKAEKIAKANEHIKKGEDKQAVEVLRDAGIYLNLTVAFLPEESTASAIEKAVKLIDDNKYYEANLVLKGIEDSVTVDSQTFIEWLEAMPGRTKKG